LDWDFSVSAVSSLRNILFHRKCRFVSCEVGCGCEAKSWAEPPPIGAVDPISASINMSALNFLWALARDNILTRDPV
jgi:hypothetical protein